MKKLFLLIAIGGLFIACNNNTQSTEEKSDTSAAMQAPSPVTVSPDTTKKADTTVNLADTTKQ